MPDHGQDSTRRCLQIATTRLSAIAKFGAKCFFMVPEGCGTIPKAAHMDFKKTGAWTDLVTVVRMLLEKRAAWGLGAHVAQVDFAQAYDSILHVAIRRAMHRRSVPDASAMA